MIEIFWGAGLVRPSRSPLPYKSPLPLPTPVVQLVILLSPSPNLPDYACASISDSFQFILRFQLLLLTHFNISVTKQSNNNHVIPFTVSLFNHVWFD